MGLFDTLHGTAECPQCKQTWPKGIQTEMLDSGLFHYDEWDEVVPGVNMSLEPSDEECPCCGHAFMITPTLVMGFLCPFSEVPPKVYDVPALIEWLVRCSKENCEAKKSEAWTRHGLTWMMDVHVRELDGEDHLQSMRNYPSQYGCPMVDEGMSSEHVIRLMLGVLRERDDV
jgi:hypothetical protein